MKFSSHVGSNDRLVTFVLFCDIRLSTWIIFVAYLFARQARVDDMNIHDNAAVKQTYAMLEERTSQAGDVVGVGGGDRDT